MVTPPEPDEPDGLVDTRRAARTGPRLFDWCGPGRTQSQHDKCRGSYTHRVDANGGRGHPKWITETVTCECPHCRHQQGEAS